MSSRKVLAANIRKLIAATATDGQKQSVRAWALANQLDVRLIDRLVKAEHSVSVDKLDEVAAACGLTSWQLLYPDFDPSHHPVRVISETDTKLLEALKRLLST
jgi:hypothetical protein